MRDRVLLTGASSQIGVFAIPRLLAAGFLVIAVSRKGRPDNFPVLEGVEWSTGADALEASIDCQYLLSAGPMDLARKYLQGSRQFHTAVVFSSSSVISKQESGNAGERQLVQELLAEETELELMADKFGSKLLIFRPTLVYGCGLDRNISRLAGMIRRFGFVPVNGKASGLRQPVHADDLATIAVKALRYEETLPRKLALSGGSTLSYSKMVSSIFTAFDKSIRLLRLPGWVIFPLLKLWGVFANDSEINPEMVKRQLVDLVYDDRMARDLLDYNPRPFRPTRDDFYLPDIKVFPGAGTDI